MKTAERNISILNQLLEKELKNKDKRKKAKAKRVKDANYWWENQYRIANAEIRDFVQQRGW